MAIRIQKIRWAVAGIVLLSSLTANAQVQVGDNLKMNLSGILSGGYNAVYGNQITSSHGLDVGGNGTLSGYYYDPNFLSFALSPYYNQAHANSEFRSLFNTGGLDFTSNIFGGSRFSGSIGFSKNWDSEGSFGVPGVADYTTLSSGQGLNIGWSALVTDYPTLTATFTTGSSEYDVIGSDQKGDSGYQNLNLYSGYKVAGFNLNGFFNAGHNHTNTPEVIGSQNILEVDSHNKVFGFSASHPLPMQGSFSASYSRSYVNTDYLGYSYNGTIDTVNGSVGINPTSKLNLSLTTGYNDNLAGTFFQVAGGTPQQPGVTPNGGVGQSNEMSSHSFYTAGYANYRVTRDFLVDAQAQYRQQEYLGSSYSATTYGGGAHYVHGLFGGFFSASGGVLENSGSTTNGHSISFSTNLNYSRTIQSWVVSGGFSYAQNVQSFLISYTNSFYTYTGNVRHRFWDQRLVWSAAAAGSHSALTQDPHIGNSSQSYSTSFGLRHISASGTYTMFNGYGLLGGGVLPPGLPPGVIPPEWLIFYDGHSYSYGVGVTPVRRLSIGANYARAWNDTVTGGVPSLNHFDQANAILTYQLRKLTFTASYGRLLQEFSASGTAPGEVTSYSFALSRSFNFF